MIPINFIVYSQGGGGAHYIKTLKYFYKTHLHYFNITPSPCAIIYVCVRSYVYNAGTLI